jgi:hypothetical protein
MNDDVAKCGGLSPNLVRLSSAELRGEGTACLSNDHQVMNHPGLDELVAGRGRFSQLDGL